MGGGTPRCAADCPGACPLARPSARLSCRPHASACSSTRCVVPAQPRAALPPVSRRRRCRRRRRWRAGSGGNWTPPAAGASADKGSWPSSPSPPSPSSRSGACSGRRAATGSPPPRSASAPRSPASPAAPCHDPPAAAPAADTTGRWRQAGRGWCRRTGRGRCRGWGALRSLKHTGDTWWPRGELQTRAPAAAVDRTGRYQNIKSIKVIGVVGKTACYYHVKDTVKIYWSMQYNTILYWSVQSFTCNYIFHMNPLSISRTTHTMIIKCEFYTCYYWETNLFKLRNDWSLPTHFPGNATCAPSPWWTPHRLHSQPPPPPRHSSSLYCYIAQQALKGQFSVGHQAAAHKDPQDICIRLSSTTLPVTSFHLQTIIF